MFNQMMKSPIFAIRKGVHAYYLSYFSMPKA